MQKRIVLLGASGSIGMQTMDIVFQHPDLFAVRALGVGHNITALEKILARLDVKTIAVQEEKDAEALRTKYPDKEIYWGKDGLDTLASLEDYDVLVNALVGFAGFSPTLCAIEHRHEVALANKETLVVGGCLINEALKKYNVKLIPIDSEHSAIYQCLQGNRRSDVERLWITCSGGAFRNLSRDEMKNVTAEQALAHPNWTMGPKITIDCANLMNKGFEVIEAHWLFNMDYDRIRVLIHPQSIVHSMVEYRDHSIMAQLGAPDMRLPIQYALTGPDRYPFDQKNPLDLAASADLHFEAPDMKKYPLLKLACETGKKGGNLCAVMNGANEEANAAFRQGKIPFLAIEEIVISAVHAAEFREVRTIEDLYEGDRFGRNYALNKIKEFSIS